MIKSKYNIIFGTILLWVVFDSVQVFINPHDSIFVKIVKKNYFEKVLQNTQNFYESYDVLLETDEAIMLGWLWPETVQNMKIRYKNDPFFRLQNRELEIETYKAADELTVFMTDPTDDVLLEAIYCDKNGYDNDAYDLLRNIQDGAGGYGDTHFLIGLLILESLNCVDELAIEEDRNNVIDNIIKAVDKDYVFSDLFAERIVVLYWSGQKKYIKYKWIDMIVKNQKLNGGWMEVGVKETDPHITGLSALAIKYFIEDDVGDDIWFVK